MQKENNGLPSNFFPPSIILRQLYTALCSKFALLPPSVGRLKFCGVKEQGQRLRALKMNLQNCNVICPQKRIKVFNSIESGISSLVVLSLVNLGDSGPDYSESGEFVDAYLCAKPCNHVISIFVFTVCGNDFRHLFFFPVWLILGRNFKRWSAKHPSSPRKHAQIRMYRYSSASSHRYRRT